MNKQKFTDALTALETSTQLHKDAIGYSQRAIEQNQLAVKLLIEATEEKGERAELKLEGKYSLIDEKGLQIFSTADAYRKYIVDLAKEEIADFPNRQTTIPFKHKEEDIEKREFKDGKTTTYATMNEKFIVNKEKRTIVCLLVGHKSNHIYARGIAKCDPNDTFNEHLGKVIAFYRAASEEVPEIFTTVPNPEKAKAGDIIQWWEKNKFYKINDINEKFDYDLYYVNENRHCGFIPYGTEKEFMQRVHKIIDDSDRK